MKEYKLLVLTRGYALLQDDDTVLAYYDYFGRPHRVDLPKALEQGDMDIIMECGVKKQEFFRLISCISFEFNKFVRKRKAEAD